MYISYFGSPGLVVDTADHRWATSSSELRTTFLLSMDSGPHNFACRIWVVYSILGFPKDCNILEATKSYKLEAWPLTTATAATITTTTATTIVRELIVTPSPPPERPPQRNN
ncbi:hypothetical protein P167DRAFT_546888 [Morchella conica CCBAS932]|uniref:Uncharacterized protein n=1 Tax=Morchella conica CCBAS932 TaxID=1392247 RepID=A0A3N4KJN9_9PEZI|nr:hypothetical protein P167DRAFT_546888 [Morchella conica CCBAS932]